MGRGLTAGQLSLEQEIVGSNPTAPALQDLSRTFGFIKTASFGGFLIFSTTMCHATVQKVGG